MTRTYPFLLAIFFVAACDDGPTGPSTPAASFFVTSQTSVTGNLGGLTGADATCQRLGRWRTAGRTWRAYLSVERNPELFQSSRRTPEIGLGRGPGTTSTCN